MMYWAVDYTDGPVVIRYPRGRGSKRNYKNQIESIQLGKSKTLHTGNEIAVISLGEIGTEVNKAITETKLQEKVTHIDARFMKPLDQVMLKDVFKTYKAIITIEDGCLIGGFGQSIKTMALDERYKGKIVSLGLPDEFIEHGEVDELRAQYDLDANSIHKTILQLLQ